MLELRYFKTVDDIKRHLQTGEPTLYVGSKSSTVIPFENLTLSKTRIIGDLTGIKPEIELTPEYNFKIRGAVTWKMLKSFAISHGRDVLTTPTEELALVLSGIATSATGERSFGYGNLRSQIVSIQYLDYAGNEIHLSSHKKLTQLSNLEEYQSRFKPYEKLKNGPSLRLEYETDLMCGSEGQLGVIVGCEIKSIPFKNTSILAFQLPKWEIADELHLDIHNIVQAHRSQIRIVEFLDHNSLLYSNVPFEKNTDALFWEIADDQLEYIYDEVISKLKISTTLIKQLTDAKWREIRTSIPRNIFEENARAGVSKKGTDAQVSTNQFSCLLEIYRKFSRENIKYNLFGHFGDSHLHFNFMPTNGDENNKSFMLFNTLYKEILAMHGTPFAEHGIGILKQPFIQPFFSPVEKQMFKQLKSKHDPHNQFFPEGYLSID